MAAVVMPVIATVIATRRPRLRVGPVQDAEEDRGTHPPGELHQRQAKRRVQNRALLLGRRLALLDQPLPHRSRATDPDDRAERTATAT